MSEPRERGPSAILLLDRALTLLRRAGPGLWAYGMLASLPLGAAMLLVYYLECVALVRSPRLLFALIISAAFCVRFALMARLARAFVQLATPSLPLPAAHGTFTVATVKTAALAGMLACVWALPLVFVGRLSVLVLIAGLPLASLGALALPSLLARAGCTHEAGFTVLTRAWDDTRAVQGSWLALTAWASLCLPWLFVNLYALAALSLLLASSVLGLDVTGVAEFLSPDNDAVLLLFLGLAALLLEPFRAAVSALAFHEARQQRDGADLHALIDALPSAPNGLKPA